MTNKELIDRYPFLIPRSYRTGEVIEDYNLENPDYTLLDDMPDGWRGLFGEQMCEEIRNALLEAQEKDPSGGYDENWITTNYDSDKIIPYLEGYRIAQIKSKYAELRWYDNGAPQSVHDIITKYMDLSRYTCEWCGKPAKWISKGWIDPYCDDCAKEYLNSEKDHLSSDNIEKFFTPISEFYKKD